MNRRKLLSGLLGALSIVLLFVVMERLVTWHLCRQCGPRPVVEGLSRPAEPPGVTPLSPAPVKAAPGHPLEAPAEVCRSDTGCG